MMAIPMEKATHILGLVTPDLAIEEPGLGTVGACGLTGREAPSFAQAVGFEEAAQGGVGGHGIEIGAALGKDNEIVVVQLDAPALVRGVLGKDGLPESTAHRPLLAGIGAQLAPQHWIAALLQRAIVPTLDG
jgi:hypothetical protein